MAKILFLSAQYPPDAKGGGEISTHILAMGLQERGHTVTVITSGLAENERHTDGVRVITLPLGLHGKPLFERRASKKAVNILCKHIKDFSQYDVVHAHDFRSALMLAVCNPKNAVVTARDYAQISGCTNNIQADGTSDPGCQGLHELYACHRIAEASFLRKLFRMWQYNYNIRFRRAAFRCFCHQVFISHAQQKMIAKHQDISHQNTTVIYNPISAEYLTEALSKGKAGNVLYAGRVEMYKGVLVLIKAWKKLIHTNQHAHLTIAGNGAQREEYENLAARWGMQYRVTFIPHVPYHRLKGLINNSEIVVAPHVWVEPFGRTVIEGMSRGKIVIASNSGGPAEIIQHEKTGLLFESGSVKGLTSALEQALTMNRLDKKEMGIAARDYVRDTLNMQKIAQEHEEFYSTCQLLRK
ncbi:MAG TPA: glycosyltransferase family 4 protein [Candidatus Andersenbacteria bacterium]|nr:glycosyltransferase family 4 protein [Candidatus Andersenbacteria bacterium]